MMNNDAAPSYFNGGTYQQYVDYRWVKQSKLLFNASIQNYLIF